MSVRTLLEQRADSIAPGRMIRFVQFCLVGGIGAVLDLALTFALLGQTHYLLANAAGFLLAVSSNFAGNWLWTYGRPDGRLRWQYASYVLLHSMTFLARAAIVVLVIEIVGGPATAATLLGVATAAVLNFAGVEKVLGGSGKLWFDAVDAMNHAAHVIYSSRIRHWLLVSGLYGVVFRAYARAINLLYRTDEREISINGAEANVLTERPTETVSVLHTLENERPILAQFLDDLEADDVVLDVGANLGIFSVLGGDIAQEVVAIEPHGPTAQRCVQNLVRNDVDGSVLQLALGHVEDTVTLSIENDRVGTQRPSVMRAGSDVQQVPGDDLDCMPTVVKIDVEGAEQNVLVGLGRTLQLSVRLVYVECHDAVATRNIRGQLEHAGFDVEKVTQSNQDYLRATRA